MSQGGLTQCELSSSFPILSFPLSPRFVSCLLEQPEVLVVGAGRGHAGRIIHKLFVNAQRVCEIPS